MVWVHPHDYFRAAKVNTGEEALRTAWPVRTAWPAIELGGWFEEMDDRALCLCCEQRIGHSPESGVVAWASCVQLP